MKLLTLALTASATAAALAFGAPINPEPDRALFTTTTTIDPTYSPPPSVPATAVPRTPLAAEANLWARETDAAANLSPAIDAMAAKGAKWARENRAMDSRYKHPGNADLWLCAREMADLWARDDLDMRAREEANLWAREEANLWARIAYANPWAPDPKGDPVALERRRARCRDTLATINIIRRGVQFEAEAAFRSTVAVEARAGSDTPLSIAPREAFYPDVDSGIDNLARELGSSEPVTGATPGSEIARAGVAENKLGTRETDAEANLWARKTDAEANLWARKTDAGANLWARTSSAVANLWARTTDASANLWARETNTEANLWARETDGEANLWARMTSANANLWARETDAEANLWARKPAANANLWARTSNAVANLWARTSEATANLWARETNVKANLTTLSDDLFTAWKAGVQDSEVHKSELQKSERLARVLQETTRRRTAGERYADYKKASDRVRADIQARAALGDWSPTAESEAALAELREFFLENPSQSDDLVRQMEDRAEELAGLGLLPGHERRAEWGPGPMDDIETRPVYARHDGSPSSRLRCRHCRTTTIPRG